MKLSAEREVQIESDVSFTDQISWQGHLQLACPMCGDGYLHHDVVDVFERLKGEDGDAFRFRVDGSRIETNLVAGAPGRRNTVEIRFYCEFCSFGDLNRRTMFFTLQIIQHKGCTYLSWARAYSTQIEDDANAKT